MSDSARSSNIISVRRILALLVPVITLLLCLAWISMPHVTQSWPSVVTMDRSGVVRLAGIYVPSGPVRDAALRVIAGLSREPVRLDVDMNCSFSNIVNAASFIRKAGTNWVLVVHDLPLNKCAYQR